MTAYKQITVKLFLSTLSLRRATVRRYRKHIPQCISIHALLAESDLQVIPLRAIAVSFLSTLSLRRATWPGLLARPFFLISIHALLAESDTRLYSLLFLITISIHALLAESDGPRLSSICRTRSFLSTLSLRRATSEAVACRPDAHISIHALLAESDVNEVLSLVHVSVISIHALLAESDSANSSRAPPTVISIHALLAESDAF